MDIALLLLGLTVLTGTCIRERIRDIEAAQMARQDGGAS